MMFATPEALLGLWLSHSLHATIGLAAPISLLSGPKPPIVDTKAVDPTKNVKSAPTIACAAGAQLDPNIASSGQFIVLLPRVSIGWWF